MYLKANKNIKISYLFSIRQKYPYKFEKKNKINDFIFIF